MFTMTHFIWLGIVAFIVVGMFLLCKFKKVSYNFILTVMVIVCILSEVAKILNNMVDNPSGGKVLDPGSLPFHLCSIQIFFVFALKFIVKDEKVKQKLLGFMFPTMLVGGFLAIMIPTCGTEFNKVQVYQYFLFHAFVIFFGLYIIVYKFVTIDFKMMFRNIAYLLVLTLFVTWVNSFLKVYGVNFMYLCRPPMKNLPILNLDHGWFAYFFTLLGIGILLMVCIHLPFAIIEKKKRNKKDSNEKVELTESKA